MRLHPLLTLTLSFSISYALIPCGQRRAIASEISQTLPQTVNRRHRGAGQIPGLPASGAAASETPAPAAETFTLPSSRLSVGVDESYVLGAGDIVSIGFFNVPEYDGEHRISNSGTVNLPLVGRVFVRGMTLSQANEAIARRYAYQLQDPIVSVSVVEQRPLQVAVSGEIVRPGLYTLDPEESSSFPRLFQALQEAGGLTQAADIKQISVQRTGPVGTTTIRVNLLSLLQNGDLSQNIFLQDGDVIAVPSASEIDSIALNYLQDSNLQSVSDQPLDIAIVGEVTQPGPYRLEGKDGQATVVQALQEAGGITPSADLRVVQLKRQTRRGAQQTFIVDLWALIQDGDVAQDLILQQGDTLVVPAATSLSTAEINEIASSSISTGTIKVNVIGEVESPGEMQVRSNTSLNQALLAAGGLNRRSQKEITLVRFMPNGTVDRKAIEVDLSQDINSETNPILRPNDVVVVGRSSRAAFDDRISDFSGTFNLVWPFLLLF